MHVLVYFHGLSMADPKGSATMVIHIDTQLETVFDLYNDAAQAKGITTEEADLRSTTCRGR